MWSNMALDFFFILFFYLNDESATWGRGLAEVAAWDGESTDQG